MRVGRQTSSLGGREHGSSPEQIFSEAFVPYDFTPKVGAYLLDLVGFTRL
jgi:hypothetical protein